ncbi:hypothetical protein EV361DRAFT_901245 [Lentinula raphanica]|uniref:Uncharacterized protein n=1 Tax=Lentinula raphanica TaxID=153919 RepID=A0AA38P4P7_9AGAR|nr:hypothetical protein C8R42DRAFT_673116 [Lentinula raphanica]KAJ3773894.1 hypothetical protein FB446DRAFT_507591 [Lentinula raphanica]KAJ3823267.1 hypothetical protein F5880DRAFT_1568428 [Lentinula raphanica]KAJ3836141.1 hypothetical protein F5878DRAFT_587067 [Lentinula raphanica]KAJ3973231.1 hypothetical protein EV361DRAFT_901245 [Lentinula raphanica]
MPPSRLSTVFDLSGLRLHTDGTLVPQSTKNHDLRLSKRTVRDAHGNWMAKDAGGLASVPKYRKVLPIPRENEFEGQEEDLDTALSINNDRNKEGTSHSREFKTSRARKRRKFATDEEYLAPSSSSCTPYPTAGTARAQMPPPSSDLLKYIHHYASTYYDERGLLLNASQQYRKEKKARRLARLSQGRNSGRSKRKSTSDTDTENHSSSEKDEIVDEDDDEDDEDGDEGSEKDDQEQQQHENGSKAPVRRKDHDLADMYKTLDGSALIAIGMLLQEHVAELLYPQMVSDS